MINTWINTHIYITDTKLKKGKINVTNEDFIIPKTADSILIYNYNVKHLKSICKYYNLKQSGNKCMLSSSIYYYLYYSKYCKIIQRTFRKYLLFKLNKKKGKSLIKRSFATNTDDFLTLDSITNILPDHYFSFESNDHNYGFSIKSIYNIIINSSEPKNPYNRVNLSKKAIIDLKECIKLSNILNIKIDMSIDNKNMFNNKFKIIELFHKIDLLGNYSDYTWFMTLNKEQLINLHRNLYDIWIWRAQLTEDHRKKICYPSGKPFETYNNSQFLYTLSVNQIHNHFINVFYNLLTKAIDIEHQKLGAYYILGALTIVNSEAANSLSWLYNSFMYI